MRFTTYLAGIIIIPYIFGGCEYPYSPQAEAPVSSDTVTNEINKVFPVNGAMQICNSSISNDTDRFPGCMLWLNFGGALPVNISETTKDYDTVGVVDHDRLTISDTSNTVVWYMKIDELGAIEGEEELQDPEWTTHPDCIVSLLSSELKTKWACYAIHLSSKHFFKVIDQGLDQTSTPHIWIPPANEIKGDTVAVTYGEDNCADSTSIHTFFGTASVKVVYNKEYSLYLKDYSSGGDFVALRKPVGRETWRCESPLISPDGNWIVYNLYESVRYYEIYLQRLSADGVPFLIKEDAADPHWWVHPSDRTLTYIIYEEVPGVTFISGDYTNTIYQKTGELGSTSRQLLRLFPNEMTQTASVIKIGLPELLLNLPTKGGLSPDGKYLCTGYKRAFMIGLP